MLDCDLKYLPLGETSRGHWLRPFFFKQKGAARSKPSGALSLEGGAQTPRKLLGG
jgi:hypothetical protein